MDRVCSLEWDTSCVFAAPERGFESGCATVVAVQNGAYEGTLSKPILSPLEQAVVALAAFDHRRSVDPPGRLDRFAQWLFGQAMSTQMADGRLEALRRYAVLARINGGMLSQAERDRFLAAGFSVRSAAEVERLTVLAQARR